MTCFCIQQYFYIDVHNAQMQHATWCVRAKKGSEFIHYSRSRVLLRLSGIRSYGVRLRIFQGNKIVNDAGHEIVQWQGPPAVIASVYNVLICTEVPRKKISRRQCVAIYIVSSVADADYLFAPDPDFQNVLISVKNGIFSSPHFSSSLIMWRKILIT